MNLHTLFSQSNSLPQIPKIVLELIESFSNEDIDIAAIAQKVSSDPVLTAKVLRLANSAHYGIPKTVSSVEEASVLLGLSSLRTMILASCMSNAFKPMPGYDQVSFWKSAFTVAAYAKFLAHKTDKVDAEVAFTTGMLHSIGSLIIRHNMPQEAASIDEVEKVSKTKRHDLEQAQLGFDYTEVGGELAKRWKFPDAIQQAITEQVAYDNNQPYNNLAAILYLAKYLEHALREQMPMQEIDNHFPRPLGATLNLSFAEIEAELDNIRELNSGLDALLD